MRLRRLFYKNTNNKQKINIYKNENVKDHMIGRTRFKGFFINNILFHSEKMKKYYSFINTLSKSRTGFVPAAHWITDNYYVIKREAESILKTIDKKEIKSLPRIASGHLKGIPRIYLIANLILKSQDYHIDEDMIVDYINKYQENNELDMEEIVQLGTMLKIALLEKIYEISGEVYNIIRTKKNADILFDKILQDKKPHINTEHYYDSAFISHIIYRLSETDIDEGRVINRLKEWAGNDIDTAELLNNEKETQTRLQVELSSLVKSLINTASMDFESIIKKVCIIDKVLSHDPFNIYARMDNDTKQSYRKAVSKIAYNTNIMQSKAAEKVLETAKNAVDSKFPEKHVGYYLFTNKKEKIIDSLGGYKNKRLRIKNRIKKRLYKLFFPLLAAGIILLALAAALYTEKIFGPGFILLKILFYILTAVISWGIMLEVLNMLFTNLIKPEKLPSMDIEKGIGNDLKTIVVMPVLTGSIEEVKKYLEKLEVYYHGNKDKNLYFALLSDYKDAKKEIMPKDSEIIDFAKSKIDFLNNKYSDSETRFFLLHRKRLLNEKENCWMGWERKRGKIEEFNRLLAGDAGTSFEVIYGDQSVLRNIKYVITIDADTELVRDSAKKLVALMSHPLNRPVLSDDQKRVVFGYTIIQPEIGIRMSDALESHFSGIFAGFPGIDNYNHAVSDLYQDAFKEGIFTGKGIYDADIFNKVLSGNIPENSVLSHDLLEGSYVRCAFAGNIKLMDGYPKSVLSFFKREHRWIRGDWQLLPWLFGKDSLSRISRYKILDNLRRSLEPALRLLFIFMAAYIFNWEGLYIFIFALFSAFFNILKAAFQPGFYINIFKSAYQGLLMFVMLPYRAYNAFDAIIRALYRMKFSGSKMLEWQTAESCENHKSSVLLYYRKMWVSPLLGILSAFLTYYDAVFYVGYIIAVLFVISPVISYSISIPKKHVEKRIDKDKFFELKYTARKTWKYFEDFFDEKENYLTPDNFQVSPVKTTARRTSPTNIGIQMIASISAWDFGYISTLKLLDRLNKVFKTIEKMEKWNGHLYNWYDTRTLNILKPKYVSTVDSGNFAAYLLVIKNTLSEMKTKPLLSKNNFNGIIETFKIADIEIPIFKIPENILEWENFISKAEEITNENSKNKENIWINSLKNMISEIKEIIMLHKNENKKIACISSLANKNNEKALLFSEQVESLKKQIVKLYDDIDFSYLYDKKIGLFHIGINIEGNIPDKSYYDLLASESRLASFIAIAKNQVPQKHWFKLGRPAAKIHNRAALVSWSGTMFEYLMPSLIVKSIKGTMLDTSIDTIINRQIDYCTRLGVPWGISESGYYRFDNELNYQYRAFGVPDIGLRTDLKKNLVIAPYASILAVGRKPARVADNLKKLSLIGMQGDYGYYEAVDFLTKTKDTVKKYKIISSFMIHHQGMALIALDNYINNNPMIERFHKEPAVKSVDLLLEERKIPGYSVKKNGIKREENRDDEKISSKNKTREIENFLPKYPSAHILSNGRYNVLLTASGISRSWIGNMSVTRWRPYLNTESYGVFFYVRDLSNGNMISAAFEPVKKKPEFYNAVFTPDKAVITRVDMGLEIKTEIAVCPGRDAEVRRLTIINKRNKPAEIDVTSAFEPVLASYQEDVSHSSFCKLFLSTEIIKEHNAIIAKRRPKTGKKDARWIFNSISVKGKAPERIEYETDRTKFIGRKRDLSSPLAMLSRFPLSGAEGNVIDTIMSIRVPFVIGLGRKIVLSYTIGTAKTREEAVKSIEWFKNPHSTDDVFNSALFDSKMELKYFGIEPRLLNAAYSLAGSMFYPSRLMRGPLDIIEKNVLNKKDLWKFGISGDYPVILAVIGGNDDILLLNDVVLVYEFLLRNGIKADLVILNRENDNYMGIFSKKIQDVISNRKIYYPGITGQGIHVINEANISIDEKNLLYTAARVVFDKKNRVVSKRLIKMLNEPYKECQVKFFPHKGQKYDNMPFENIELKYYNTIGGFSYDGKEYVIELKEDKNTPAPWVNVVSGKSFGFLISETGAGYTWNKNSRENKLTGWNNDAVTDKASECIYIRDNRTGDIFSPFASYKRDNAPYRIRHGFGYSIFKHNSCGISQEVKVFVPENSPVKIYFMELYNTTDARREFSLYFYAEPVLGTNRDRTGEYIISSMNTENNMFILKNSFNEFYSNYVMFAGCSEKITSYTGDKGEFCKIILKSGEQKGLFCEDLDNRTGAALDSCCAYKVDIELNKKSKKEIVFILGEAPDYETAEILNSTYSNVNTAENTFYKVKSWWSKYIDNVQIQTPDDAMNTLMNGWLTYQTISCRFRTRSAFYQCGGAFGFRDQLQDVLSLLHFDISLVKEHIIKCCMRQFKEGDVLHWWHEEDLRGVRTKISDDLLWLPYAVCEYVEFTDDIGILNIKAEYLEGEILSENEHEKYMVPNVSDFSETVYMHCIRAIEKAYKTGRNGLLLMGAGDWNDGMNMVGIKGKGESVWLSWFYIKVINMFAEICDKMDDEKRKEEYRKRARDILSNIEKNAWDGEWYKRAFFDDGSPIGTKNNSECIIDSISQSWSAIAGGAKDKSITALEAVKKYLVDRNENIIKLLTPPFDKSIPSPGYIQGYNPGIRENGGQYTHGAIWNIIAAALLEKGEDAFEMFSMLNPINHTNNYSKMAKYKTEPYVMSADVYSSGMHAGRGGWSWYTGSAGWMYQAGLKYILGIIKKADRLYLKPVIPKEWKYYSVNLKHKSSTYFINVQNPHGLGTGRISLMSDGKTLDTDYIVLDDKGGNHTVLATIEKDID